MWYFKFYYDQKLCDSHVGRDEQKFYAARTPSRNTSHQLLQYSIFVAKILSFTTTIDKFSPCIYDYIGDAEILAEVH